MRSVRSVVLSCSQAESRPDRNHTAASPTPSFHSVNGTVSVYVLAPLPAFSRRKAVDSSNCIDTKTN